MPPASRSRPGVLLPAAALLGAAAVAFVVLGILSLTAGHGQFSGGVAVLLFGWAVIVGTLAEGVRRAKPWARGPAAAASLLHLASCVSFAGSQPWAWLGVGVAAGTIALLVVPAATAAFRPALSDPPTPARPPTP